MPDVKPIVEATGELIGKLGKELDIPFLKSFGEEGKSSLSLLEAGAKGGGPEAKEIAGFLEEQKGIFAKDTEGLDSLNAEGRIARQQQVLENYKSFAAKGVELAQRIKNPALEKAFQGLAEEAAKATVHSAAEMTNAAGDLSRQAKRKLAAPDSGAGAGEPGGEPVDQAARDQAARDKFNTEAARSKAEAAELDRQAAAQRLKNEKAAKPPGIVAKTTAGGAKIIGNTVVKPAVVVGSLAVAGVQVWDHYHPTAKMADGSTRSLDDIKKIDPHGGKADTDKGDDRAVVTEDWYRAHNLEPKPEERAVKDGKALTDDRGKALYYLDPGMEEPATMDKFWTFCWSMLSKLPPGPLQNIATGVVCFIAGSLGGTVLGGVLSLAPGPMSKIGGIADSGLLSLGLAILGGYAGPDFLHKKSDEAAGRLAEHDKFINDHKAGKDFSTATVVTPNPRQTDKPAPGDGQQDPPAQLKKDAPVAAP